jgi:hypothetical protein
MVVTDPGSSIGGDSSARTERPSPTTTGTGSLNGSSTTPDRVMPSLPPRANARRILTMTASPTVPTSDFSTPHGESGGEVISTAAARSMVPTSDCFSWGGDPARVEAQARRALTLTVPWDPCRIRTKGHRSRHPPSHGGGAFSMGIKSIRNVKEAALPSEIRLDRAAGAEGISHPNQSSRAAARTHA